MVPEECFIEEEEGGSKYNEKLLELLILCFGSFGRGPVTK